MAEEKLLENRFKKFLNSVGIYRLGTAKQKKRAPQVGFYWKNHEGSMFDTIKGRPDIVVFVKGRYAFFEMKATHGRPSIHQVRIIEEIKCVGGEAMLFYPKDWDDACDVIRRLINEK